MYLINPKDKHLISCEFYGNEIHHVNRIRSKIKERISGVKSKGSESLISHPFKLV